VYSGRNTDISEEPDASIMRVKVKIFHYKPDVALGVPGG
jgi:hypothetical protein